MHASSTCLRIPLAGQKYASVAAKRSPLSVPRSASSVVTHRAITSLSLRTAGSHRFITFPDGPVPNLQTLYLLPSRRQGIGFSPARATQPHVSIMNPLTFVPGEESLAATFLMGLLYHNFQSQSNPWKNTPFPHLTCLEAASHPRFSHKKFQKNVYTGTISQ